MNLRLIITIIVTKIVIKLCRLMHWGGTTLSGKIAIRLYPNIAKAVSKDFRVIMVTGTNGKTTTTRIIGQILAENGIPYITNKSGANLVYGVISTFIESVDIKGKSSKNTALIEIDEAAFKRMCDFIKPEILVVTNFFRDQLDRYGELYSTLKKVTGGIEKSPSTKLILNADDSLCASLGRGKTGNILYYGMEKKAYTGSNESVNSDAMFCYYCKTKYDYENHVYGHLGGFKCPNCGYSKPSTDITCTGIEELTSVYSKIAFSARARKIYKPINCMKKLDAEKRSYKGKNFVLSNSISDKTYHAKINLPGLYNIYNSLAAISLGNMLGLPVDKTIEALGNFECGFGRMETIVTNDKNIKLILVKNPTGFNQVIDYLLTEEKNIQLAFLINDKYADGTDISWLWDVDFEKLQHIQEKTDNIYTSGIRAEDMALRLKYAGIFTDKISVIRNYSDLIDKGLERTSPGHSFYILPTYTAMLDIRNVLRKKFGLKEFWK
ncbi:MAG: MurT ligase domain-containing protein [Bacillota bacterium]|nr:MurT ligase domain-containing protein [Bacillota bacterium]